MAGFPWHTLGDVDVAGTKVGDAQGLGCLDVSCEVGHTPVKLLHACVTMVASIKLVQWMASNMMHSSRREQSQDWDQIGSSCLTMAHGAAVLPVCYEHM